IGDSHWQPDADETQWPAFEIYPDSPWNYGLLLDSSDLASSFTLHEASWSRDSLPFTPENVPFYVTAKARRIPQWTLDQYGLCGLLRQSPVAVNTPVEEVTLIPMGATRLRISAFPQVSAP